MSEFQIKEGPCKEDPCKEDPCKDTCDNPFEEDPFEEDPFEEDPFEEDPCDDPFDKKTNKDTKKIDDLNNLNNSMKNDIIIQTDQRNARKFTTSIINFPDTLPVKAFISDVKKSCQCNGSIKNNRKNPEKAGNIEFSGNIKNKVRAILIGPPYNISDNIIKLQGV